MYLVWFRYLFCGRYGCQQSSSFITLPSELVYRHHFWASSRSLLFFILKNGRDYSDATRLSKFTTSLGWFLKCVMWPSSGGRYFLHVHSGDSQKGWCSFLDLLSDFLKKWKSRKSKTRQRSQHNVLNTKDQGHPPPFPVLKKQSVDIFCAIKNSEVFLGRIQQLMGCFKIIWVWWLERNCKNASRLLSNKGYH